MKLSVLLHLRMELHKLLGRHRAPEPPTCQRAVAEALPCPVTSAAARRCYPPASLRFPRCPARARASGSCSSGARERAALEWGGLGHCGGRCPGGDWQPTAAALSPKGRQPRAPGTQRDCEAAVSGQGDGSVAGSALQHGPIASKAAAGDGCGVSCNSTSVRKSECCVLAYLLGCVLHNDVGSFQYRGLKGGKNR